MHKGPDRPEVVLQLFRERQGAADKTRNSLPQGAVEAFNVVCFAAAFAYSFMALAREDLSVRFPEVSVEDGALPVSSRQRVPKALCTRLASTADEHADDLSG